MKWVYSALMPFLNTVGALWAMGWNLRAAKYGRPGTAGLRVTIALIAGLYAVAYSALWTGVMTDRARWSEVLAAVSAVSWVVAWAEPARRSLNDWRAAHAAIEQKVAATVWAAVMGDEQ